MEVVKFAPVPGISRTGIDRAGVALREWWTGDEGVTDATIEAFRVMIMFREAFQPPLNKTAMGLRSMVCSEWQEVRVANVPVVQRLKRREQIIKKLARFPESKLANMGDIGGCRAVLRDRQMVDRVVKRIRKNWPVHGIIRDTRDEAAPTGYRAVHIIVIRDGRRIEIQLREHREQEWAVAVERTGVRLGIGLKEGEGPDDLREYFRLASLGMYRDSVGDTPGPDFDAEFAAARDRVRRFFES